MQAAANTNMLLEEIQYSVQETAHGVWRRFLYPSGQRFAEFRSHLAWGNLPLVHYTYGVCPETGKRITARGVIAIGRFARGMIAIGQVSLGLVAIGQFSFGLIFCLAQFGAAPAASVRPRSASSSAWASSPRAKSRSASSPSAVTCSLNWASANTSSIREWSIRSPRISF